MFHVVCFVLIQEQKKTLLLIESLSNAYNQKVLTTKEVDQFATLNIIFDITRPISDKDRVLNKRANDIVFLKMEITSNKPSMIKELLVGCRQGSSQQEIVATC